MAVVGDIIVVACVGIVVIVDVLVVDAAVVVIVVVVGSRNAGIVRGRTCRCRRIVGAVPVSQHLLRWSSACAKIVGSERDRSPATLSA